MTITVGGLVSGLDTDSLISQISELQRAPIEQLEAKVSDYEVQLSAYGTLQSYLSALQSAIEALDGESDFETFTATSGDTGLFTVSASSSAVPGSYSITVQQMARAHKLTSTAFGEEEAVGEGTISLSVGDADPVVISVSDTDTVQDVAQAINDADAGVQAAVVFDGTDYYLTFSSEETGEDNVITLTVTDTGDGNDTDANGLSRLVYEQGVTENLTQSQAAKDAVITVDGVSDIHRSTNTLDDVIDGVTITLKSEPAAPDNQAELTVSRNTAAIVSKINAFVSTYNQCVQVLDSLQSYDSESESAGILLGDSTTRMIQNRLADRISSGVSGVDNFTYLSDLGITFDEDGLLEVDSADLTGALEDHFEDVVQFFTQDTEDAQGLGVRLAEILDTFVDSTDGVITARTEGIQDSIDDIDDQIERMEARIEASEETLWAQFNALELLLAEYQTIQNYLTQQIEGLQNLNAYIANK